MKDSEFKLNASQLQNLIDRKVKYGRLSSCEEKLKKNYKMIEIPINGGKKKEYYDKTSGVKVAETAHYSYIDDTPSYRGSKVNVSIYNDYKTGIKRSAYMYADDKCPIPGDDADKFYLIEIGEGLILRDDGKIKGQVDENDTVENYGILHGNKSNGSWHSKTLAEYIQDIQK